MLTAYERMEGGAVVWRCYDYGSEAEIPETVEGLPVAELAPYAFSAHMDEGLLEKGVREGRLRLWDSDNPASSALSWEDAELPPPLTGAALTSVSLPPSLRKIGAYAFYNCSRLHTLRLHGGLMDLGAGLFTGCHAIRELALRLDDGTILRVARSMDSVLRTALEVLPGMTIIAGIMLAFALALSRWQVRRLIRPINELKLDDPLENEIYEEITPLLRRIDEQNKEKDAIANMRKEFSANVSHELKTPLTSISGYAEIMKNGMVRPEDMKKFSERIYNEASRLITLVEDIIKLSKLDEGEIEVEKEDVDLYEMTREIVSRLAPQAQARKVRVEVTGESVIYHGIRQVLDEMIYNICENAIKYNKEGGSLSVWVGSTLKGKKVIVTDTGIGIPKDQQERIFERFYRVDKSHSKETGGTGLGLSIVKHGAMIHDAQIHVESEVGKGTKMEITF